MIKLQTHAMKKINFNKKKAMFKTQNFYNLLAFLLFNIA